jgi:hypothetical protein
VGKTGVLGNDFSLFWEKGEKKSKVPFIPVLTSPYWNVLVCSVMNKQNVMAL